MLESARAVTQTQTKSDEHFYDRHHESGLGFKKIGAKVWEGGVGIHKVHVDEEVGPGIWRVVVLHTARIRLFEGFGAEERAFDCAARSVAEKFPDEKKKNQENN